VVWLVKPEPDDPWNLEVGPIEHYRRELELILMVEQGKVRGVTIPVKELSASLNQSQRQTVKELLACPDQVALLYGIHGVGKTFSLAEVVRCYLEDGHKVFVLAPENGARDVLRKEGAQKIPSGPTATVFQCAQNLSEFLVNAKLQKGFGPGDLVILDEAGMSNLEDLHNFMGMARQKGFGVIFSGDDGQLTSVTAGDAFRILKERSGIYVSMLTQIIRQSPEALDGHYLKAAQFLGEKKKKVREAFWELYQAGCIKEIKGQDRIGYYADRVMESLNGTKPSVMCNLTHRENDAISEIVRAKRKELGELTDERTLKVHRTLGWSLAQKKEIDKISPGMVLQVTRGADKGRAWKVLEVANGKALTEDPLGERRVFEKRHARMFDVCKPFDIPVAIGDHLRTHSGGKGRDKGKEIINGELFIVASWDMEGNPVDKEGKTLTIRNVSYGYTGTVRKVQGATQPKNIFGMDRQSIRAVSAELATVASTRGREDIEILVESVADLSQIEAKSSRRKAVCEMAIEPTAQPAEIRELLAQIEWVRTRGLPIAKRLTADLQVGKTGDRQQEQHERAIVDLQLGARKRAAEKFHREQINEQSKEERGMSR
jgi:AAA domain